MTARIKNFNQDLTGFLQGNIRHTVKIWTKTDTLEVSGAVISQHSKVLRNMVVNEEEILLNNYEFAKECLIILHGGSVELNEENFEEIIKFGIQFGVADVVEQGLVFLETFVIKYNLIKMVKVCWQAADFSSLCDFDYNIDYYWPLERSIEVLDLVEAEKLIADINVKLGIKVVLRMLTNKQLAKKLLKIVTSLIDQSNISEIVDAFQQYEYHITFVEAFSSCTRKDIINFFQKIEVWGLLVGKWKSFRNMTKIISRELDNRESRDHNFIPNEQNLLTCWKLLTREDILQVCRFCETSFYIFEVVMSWVALNKPDLKTVRHVCSLLQTQQVERQYLVHVIEVLKTEGYSVSFNSSNCTVNCNNNFNHTTIITTIFRSNSHADNNKVAGRVISFNKNPPNNISADHEDINVEKEEFKIEDINVEINPNASLNRRIFCEKGKVERLYGRSLSGKQITFYTDIDAAVRTDVVYDANTLHVVLEGSC